MKLLLTKVNSSTFINWEIDKILSLEGRIPSSKTIVFCSMKDECFLMKGDDLTKESNNEQSNE